MEFNVQAYSIVFLERTYKTLHNIDFTVDTTGHVLAWNVDKGVLPTAEEISTGVIKLIKQDLISKINYLSGEIRGSYLSDGSFVVEEYKLAEVDAIDYKSRLYAEPVPQTILDYASILGTTNYQYIANSILAASQQLKTVLVAVRKERLTATTSIGMTTLTSLETTMQTLSGIYDVAVLALEALRKK